MFRALLLFVLCMSAAHAQITDADLKRMRAEKRVALIIGNASYRNFQALENPVNDAKGVAEALRGASFDVTLKLDASLDEMREAIDAFADKIAGADVALFYFAGHAAQVDWRNFIVPTSAALDADSLLKGDIAAGVAQEAVDLAEVLKRMDAPAGASGRGGTVGGGAAGGGPTAGNGPTRLNIVILDACRDNPFTTEAIKLTRSLSRSTGKAPLKVIAAGLAQTSAPPGTFLAYSTAPGQVASDGNGRNSPYSGALIAALKVQGLKLEDVFKQVRNSVAAATHNEQIPWDNSSVFRDFFFRVPVSATLANTRPKGDINTTFVSP